MRLGVESDVINGMGVGCRRWWCGRWRVDLDKPTPEIRMPANVAGLAREKVAKR